MKLAKPSISFNVTLNKQNVQEIKEAINFCLREFGIEPTFTLMYTYGKDTFKDQAVDRSSLALVKEAYLYAARLKSRPLLQNLGTIYNKVISGNGVYQHPCFWPYYTTNVSWDGLVYPCCVFFDCQMVLGDLKRESFSQVWNGERYRQFRKALLRGRSGIALCQSCSLSDYNINNLIYNTLRFFPFLKPLSKRRFVKIKTEAGKWKD